VNASSRHVLVVYNADYEEEVAQATDAASVREAAVAVAEGLRAAGYVAEVAGVHGPDVVDLFTELRRRPPDLVFNQCESLSGDVRNEVLLPALLDLAGIPYTGSGPLALASCLHKERTKEILSARGVATPGYRLFESPADLDGSFELDFPVFLKLAHQDASVGIESSNRVGDRDALVRRAGEMMARWPEPLIAERYVEGREVNVTVLGWGEQLSVLPLHEIDFSAMPEGRPHIVSYAAKWDTQHPEYRGTLPVPLRDTPAEVITAIETTALAAFRALGLCDFGRVDLRVDRDGRPWVIDVNPNCDLSPDAGAARAARAGGLDYPRLLARICELAWSRHAHRPAQRAG